MAAGWGGVGAESLNQTTFCSVLQLYLWGVSLVQSVTSTLAPAPSSILGVQQLRHHLRPSERWKFSSPTPDLLNQNVHFPDDVCTHQCRKSYVLCTFPTILSIFPISQIQGKGRRAENAQILYRQNYTALMRRCHLLNLHFSKPKVKAESQIYYKYYTFRLCILSFSKHKTLRTSASSAAL